MPLPVENLKTAFSQLIASDLSPIASELAQKFIWDVDEGLSEFENAQNNDEKIAALNKLMSALDHIESREGSGFLGQAGRFQALKVPLFNFIREELYKAGVKTLHNPDAKSTRLSEIIANMSAEKADALMLILAEGGFIKPRLYNLYDANDISAEARRFQKFLITHTITFIGGGNSKNYKVTENGVPNAQPQVLKLDYRMGSPRYIEQHVRKELGETLLPVYAERLGTGRIYSKRHKQWFMDSRTILVTEFCQGGSVDQEALRMHQAGRVYEGAGNMGNQMCRVLLKARKANCFFSDSKMTNWSYDENGQIRIPDTKSFLFTDENGQYSAQVPGNERTHIIQTPGFIPDEYSKASLDAERAEAAILGRNLYFYLTLSKPPNRQFKDKDFNAPVFLTEQGQVYKKLILRLSDPEPEKRMSLSDAQRALFRLAHPELEAAANRLRDASTDEKRDETVQYIKDKIEICRTATVAEIQGIVDELNQLAGDLEAFNCAAERLTAASAGGDEDKINDYLENRRSELYKASTDEEVKAVIDKVNKAADNLEARNEKMAQETTARHEEKKGRSFKEFKAEVSELRGSAEDNDKTPKP